MRKITEEEQVCAYCGGRKLRCDLVCLVPVLRKYSRRDPVYTKHYMFYCLVCEKYVELQDW